MFARKYLDTSRRFSLNGSNLLYTINWIIVTVVATLSTTTTIETQEVHAFQSLKWGVTYPVSILTTVEASTRATDNITDTVFQLPCTLDDVPAATVAVTFKVAV